jgi:hypothetical protein
MGELKAAYDGRQAVADFAAAPPPVVNLDAVFAFAEALNQRRRHGEGRDDDKDEVKRPAAAASGGAGRAGRDGEVKGEDGKEVKGDDDSDFENDDNEGQERRAPPPPAPPPIGPQMEGLPRLIVTGVVAATVPPSAASGTSAASATSVSQLSEELRDADHLVRDAGRWINDRNREDAPRIQAIAVNVAAANREVARVADNLVIADRHDAGVIPPVPTLDMFIDPGREPAPPAGPTGPGSTAARPARNQANDDAPMPMNVNTALFITLGAGTSIGVGLDKATAIAPVGYLGVQAVREVFFSEHPSRLRRAMNVARHTVVAASGTVSGTVGALGGAAAAPAAVPVVNAAKNAHRLGRMVPDVSVAVAAGTGKIVGGAVATSGAMYLTDHALCAKQQSVENGIRRAGAWLRSWSPF